MPTLRAAALHPFGDGRHRLHLSELAGQPPVAPWRAERLEGIAGASSRRGVEDVLHAARISARAGRERAVDPRSDRRRLGPARPALGRRDDRLRPRPGRARADLDPIGNVVVLEDTDHDGRMDKRTVFVDKLDSPARGEGAGQRRARRRAAERSGSCATPMATSRPTRARSSRILTACAAAAWRATRTACSGLSTT